VLQVAALRSAQLAGFTVSAKTLGDAGKYVVNSFIPSASLGVPFDVEPVPSVDSALLKSANGILGDGFAYDPHGELERLALAFGGRKGLNALHGKVGRPDV
jgi:hypothetical protein